MVDPVEELVRTSVVRVLGPRPGAGFFIAPGVILTCAHVVGNEKNLSIDWDARGVHGHPALVLATVADRGRPIPKLDSDYPDLALIRVEGLDGHPCVAIDRDWPHREDKFQIYGYPEEGGSVILTPATLAYRGVKGVAPTVFLDLSSDTVKPGMSGSPLLNVQSGAVSGIVVASKNMAASEGALAVTWDDMGDAIASQLAANREFHHADSRWTEAVRWSRMAASDPFAEELDLHERDCVAHCPRSASGEPALDGRAADRARILEVAFGRRRFCWVRAPMSAGKTAVAAWLALAPPANTVTLACFVSPTTDGDQFLDVVIRRLSALLRRRTGARVTLSEKPLLLAKLLDEAEDRYGEANRHLVIVVDGLDEDPRPAGITSVAQLLPRALPEHVHLVVFSRPNPGPLPLDHPLRDGSACYDLPASEEARVEMERAQAELDRIAQDASSIPARALTMLAVAGPLTEKDLVDLLVPRMAREIALAFDGPLLRLTYGIGAGPDRSYSFGHIALQQAWTDSLGSGAVAAAVREIDSWVDGYAGQAWPAGTPAYCLDGYIDMLVRRGEAARLASIALDGGRRARLLAVTGSRVADAAVIVKAQRSMTTMAEPDAGLATRLALESFIVRNSLEEAARPEMVAFDVRRGDVRKAVDTVLTLSPEREYWADTYVELVAALYLTGRDQEAGALLERSRSEHPGARIPRLVAIRMAPELPTLAVRLAGDDHAALATMAPSLAAHDAFTDLAIRSAAGNPELQLAVALVLAPRDPQAALRALDGYTGYWEWSAGSKLLRDGSFARVETARAMTSASEARAVLTAERDGADGEAARIGLALLEATDGDGAGPADYVRGHPAPSIALAFLALGEEIAGLVDAMPPAGLVWGRSDLDLVRRFGGALAASPRVDRADYARLLRSAGYRGAESGDEAALAVLVELFAIGDFRDDDAELAARRFAVPGVRMESLYGAAARRMASTEPRRAAALALQSGPTATWTLRDVLRDIASRDLRLAVELTDIVEPQFSATRSIVLGAVGALVDPQDTGVIDALNRRIPPPETSAVAALVLADAALRLAAMLPGDDARAARLLERFPPGPDTKVDREYRTERAISLAISGDFAAAVGLMEESEPTSSSDYSTRDGWVRLAARLPAAFASKVLPKYVLPRAGRKWHRVMCALAAVDPIAAVRQLMKPPLSPSTFAAVMQIARESATGPGMTGLFWRAIADLSGAGPAEADFLLWWSIRRTSPLNAADTGLAGPDFPGLWRLLATGDARAIVARCDDEQLEPALILGVWVYENCRRLPEAVETVFWRFEDSLSSDIGDRVHLLVDAVVQSDVRAADAIIDDVSWPPTLQAELLREESYEQLAVELARYDREAAWRRASMITDSWVAGRTLAALAALIAAGPAGPPGPALSDVLNTAHARSGMPTIEFARDLVSELVWTDSIGMDALITFLAETSAWPAGESAFLFGSLFGFLRQYLEAARAAADAILASYPPGA